MENRYKRKTRRGCILSFGFFFPNSWLKKDSFFSVSGGGDTGDCCDRGVVVGESGGVVTVLVAMGVGREEANGLGGGIGGAELGPFVVVVGGVVP